MLAVKNDNAICCAFCLFVCLFEAKFAQNDQSNMLHEPCHAAFNSFVWELIATAPPDIDRATRYHSILNWKEKHGGVRLNASQWTSLKTSADGHTYGFRMGSFRLPSGNIISAITELPDFSKLVASRFFIVSAFVGGVDRFGQALSYPPLYVHHAGIIRSHSLNIHSKAWQQVFMFESDRVLWGEACNRFELPSGYGYFIESSNNPFLASFDLHHRAVSNGKSLRFFLQATIRTVLLAIRPLLPLSRVSLGIQNRSTWEGYLYVSKGQTLLVWSQFSWPSHLGSGLVILGEGHLHAPSTQYFVLGARANEIYDSVVDIALGNATSGKTLITLAEMRMASLKAASHKQMRCAISNQPDVIDGVSFARLRTDWCPPWTMVPGEVITTLYFGTYPNTPGTRPDLLGIASDEYMPFHDYLILWFASDAHNTCISEGLNDLMDSEAETSWTGRCYPNEQSR